MELLKGRRSRLELSLQLQHNFQEMVYILDSMEELKVRLLSDDYGKHLLGKFPFPVSKIISQQQFEDFFFILFFKIQLQVLRISCKNTVWLRPTSMFLGNGSNKLFNIANVSWKRKLLKATNLVILQLLLIEFQVIVYIPSKLVQICQKILKEEAAKSYQNCDPSVIVDSVLFEYLFS